MIDKVMIDRSKYRLLGKISQWRTRNSLEWFISSIVLYVYLSSRSPAVLGLPGGHPYDDLRYFHNDCR